MIKIISPHVLNKDFSQRYLGEAKKLDEFRSPISDVSFKGNMTTALCLYSSDFVRKPLGVFVPATTR